MSRLLREPPFSLRMDTCRAGAEREQKAVLEFLEKLKYRFFSSGGEETALAPNFLWEILICCSRISSHNGFSFLPTKFQPVRVHLTHRKGERNEIGVTHMVLMPGSPKKGVSQLLHKPAIFIGSSKISPTWVSLGN